MAVSNLIKMKTWSVFFILLELFSYNFYSKVKKFEAFFTYIEASFVRSVSLSMDSVRFFDRPSSPCNQWDTFDAEATASLTAGMLAAANCTVPYLPRMNGSTTCRQGIGQHIHKLTSIQIYKIHTNLLV